MTERKMEENKMPRTYKHWTKEEETLLKSLRAERFSIAEIADHMGRTNSSVNNRIAVLGFPVLRKAAIKPKPVVRPWYRMDRLMALLLGRK